MNAPETESDEAADFLARLGELDTFIGATGPVPAATAPKPVALPPLPSIVGPRMTRRLFDAEDHSEAVEAIDPADAEAADFIERLGQLDDFIASSAADPAEATPETVEDEAQDFLQRLGDLDRFIGGTPTA